MVDSFLLKLSFRTEFNGRPYALNDQVSIVWVVSIAQAMSFDEFLEKKFPDDLCGLSGGANVENVKLLTPYFWAESLHRFRVLQQQTKHRLLQLCSPAWNVIS